MSAPAVNDQGGSGVNYCANPGCMALVIDRKPGALYCGDRCKTAAHRARKAAAAQEGIVTPWLRKMLGPSALRVLYALIAADGEGATTAALCQPQVGGSRFGARVAEIRAAGLIIVQNRERNGSHRYWLIREHEWTS